MRHRWSIAGALLLCVQPLFAQHTDLKADSIAMRIVAASGGIAAWESTPFVRFNVKLYKERDLVYAVQHLWDKKLGLYRMEIPGPNNHPYVGVFYTEDFEAKVYWNGSELIKKDVTILMEQFRLRYFHDVFFLAAPFLLMEPGVERTYLPDASNEAEDIIRVTIPFWEGLPSQTFDFYSDRETGRLVRTSYPMPSGETRSFVWRDYQEYPTLDGSLFLSHQKRAEGHPFLIETAHITLPPHVAADMFTSPSAVLQQAAENASGSR